MAVHCRPLRAQRLTSIQINRDTVVASLPFKTAVSFYSLAEVHCQICPYLAVALEAVGGGSRGKGKGWAVGMNESREGVTKGGKLKPCKNRQGFGLIKLMCILSEPIWSFPFPDNQQGQEEISLETQEGLRLAFGASCCLLFSHSRPLFSLVLLSLWGLSPPTGSKAGGKPREKQDSSRWKGRSRACHAAWEGSRPSQLLLVSKESPWPHHGLLPLFGH